MDDAARISRVTNQPMTDFTTLLVSPIAARPATSSTSSTQPASMRMAGSADPSASAPPPPRRASRPSRATFALIPGNKADEWSAALGLPETPRPLGSGARRRASCRRGIIASPTPSPGPAALGWMLAQHRFDRYKQGEPAPLRVLLTGDPARIDETIALADRRRDGARSGRHARQRSSARPSCRVRSRISPTRTAPARARFARRDARERLSDDRRGRPRRRSRPRAAPDRARLGRSSRIRASPS